MLEKEFVPYEESLELKELEFNEPCFGYYIELRNPSEGILSIDNIENNADGGVLAPTYSQAFRWFREKYDLFGVVEGKGYEYKRYYIYSINGKWHPSQPSVDTPEEAELACLRKLIEIVRLSKS